MGVKKGVDFTKNEVILDIYSCAIEVFSGGIYIPSGNHICGWDWLDFSNIDDVLTYRFDFYDISDGIYKHPEQYDKTLKEVITETKGRFLFEINTNVDWEEDENI